MLDNFGNVRQMTNTSVFSSSVNYEKEESLMTLTIGIIVIIKAFSFSWIEQRNKLKCLFQASLSSFDKDGA